ncbi:restriction endonuclease [Nitratidesulfovibrio sp. D1]|uniref:restriction endonuclease n=1 Tax=Nitratidesulfovibrio sp. D1 TaxID=3440151 RepID=UPI003EB78EBE
MAIIISASELASSTSEIVGYKSGLALSLREMKNLIHEYDSASLLNRSGTIRIYPEEFEQLIADLLFRVGNIPSNSTIPQDIAFYHKIKNNPKKLRVFQNVQREFISFMTTSLNTKKNIKDNKINPTSFLISSASHGKFGLECAMTLLESVNHKIHISPWNSIRRQEYRSSIELSDLFKSSSLEAEFGNFIDQRFIDFLSNNFGSIDSMHWRKFEGLTAEFFDRNGFDVIMGPGSDDGGVDIRVYKKSQLKTDPATILIQCKRSKSKIQKAIVKSLWADVMYENAESGLIVTTSAIAPGARNDCIARGYPIHEANRETIRAWLTQMKTPGKGVFMGE